MVKACNNAALNSAMQGLSQALQNWTGLFMRIPSYLKSTNYFLKLVIVKLMWLVRSDRRIRKSIEITSSWLVLAQQVESSSKNGFGSGVLAQISTCR